MFNTEQLQEKWAPVLTHGDLPEIKDSYKKAVPLNFWKTKRNSSARREC